VRTQVDSRLVIIGAGGHGSVVVDAALAQGAWARVGVAERVATPRTRPFLPGVDFVALEAIDGLDAVHVAIGDPAARRREAQPFLQRLATIVHPAASISPFAAIEPGCFIAAQAVVGPNAKLGVSVIVNHGAVVDHDVAVGEYTHIAPNATLGGATRLGARVLLGAGARILPGIHVGDDVTIGAGAVVIAPITVPGVYAGVPARRVR
jgi:sugar O-acyltransferase (sialic acid O-acetyltransferase NeuD family)